MAIAERFEDLTWKALVGSLGFLQAQDVRRPFRHELPHVVDAHPDRVDVPANQAPHCDFAARGRSWKGRPVDTSAPGRGGRPGACMSEAFGGNRARRGNGTVLKRVW